MNRKLLILSIFTLVFAVDYGSDIQPIFDNNCINCHDSSNPAGGLNLLSYNDFMPSNVIISGNHSESELYDRITRDESENGDMPPTGSLSQDDIDLIAQWIDGGALSEESNDISGCMDPNAITCDDEIDPLYFPECDTCSDDAPCDNYYNPNATVDNGLCMYNEVPAYDELIIAEMESGFGLDWTLFVPPVDVTQYILQRCLDNDGDSDGDGILEYENCIMIIPPNSFYLDSTYNDIFAISDFYVKYTFYVHYPNNNFWGSAQGYYYLEEDPECTAGDINTDGIINVIDIVSLVNHILGSNALEGSGLCAADMNGDGIINVIDIVSVVNLILS